MDTELSQTVCLRKLPPVDFDRESLPWVDKDHFELELGRRMLNGGVDFKHVKMLKGWRESGIAVFQNLISEDLIDALVDHYERLWRERPVCRIQVGGKPCFLGDMQGRPASGMGARVLDLHNLSEAGKAIMLHPELLYCLSLIFEDTPVGMQSLFFEYGSEQALHQDFVYVPSGILSHLVGVWIALEDVGPEQGPLVYVPRSHNVQKFDLGEGKLIFDSTNRHRANEWHGHLNKEIDRLSLSPIQFLAKKGDVVFWHAALIHGGSPILCKEMTRKSFVIHYSSKTAYQRDYRNKHLEPEIIRMNGGMTYRWIHPGHLEDRYSL